MASAFPVWRKQLVKFGMSTQKQMWALLLDRNINIMASVRDINQTCLACVGESGCIVHVCTCAACVFFPSSVWWSLVMLQFLWSLKVNNCSPRSGRAPVWCPTKTETIYSSYTWEHFAVNPRLLLMTLSQQFTVSQKCSWLINLITSQCRADDVCAAKYQDTVWQFREFKQHNGTTWP